MKILVTGGAGFIGSHLCEKLLEKSYKVICLDNFNDYYDPKIKEKNIADALEHKNFRLVRGDILDNKILDKIFSEDHIKKIVHLAAVAGVRRSILKPTLYVDVDVKGTVNLLEAAKKYNVDQFIFGSSSSVYGINSKVPFSENDLIELQISPYAAAKRSAESYCATYHHLYGTPTTILRFFTVYGPRQRPDMAISKFMHLIAEGKKIPFYGDGTMRRDFTYVDDIIEGITTAIKNNFKYEVFNLGNSETISLSELVAAIGEVVGKKVKLERLPVPAGDVPVTHADISKAKILLKFKTKTNIKEGLKKQHRWMFL